MDELLKWRGEFPILDRTTYLISNSLGAMPRGVYDEMRAYADSWAQRGVRAWEEGWWEMAVAVGDKIAPLIGARPGEISLHQNVTLIQAVIASCFDFSGPRNKVVLTDLEFPSIQYFYHEQRRLGARIELVSNSDPVHLDLDKFLAAIDETTLLVPISLVLFRSSHIVDAHAIIERAHRVGAHVILDVFQAAGTIPIDVLALGADFAVGGVLKWLCGGPGVGYLYVREDLRPNLRPALTGWLAHQRPFGFETGVIAPRADSFRYLNGTPHIPALYACRPGLDILNQVGIDAIRSKSMRMTARLLDGAKSRGWRVNTPENPAERAGTVSIDCPCAQEVCRELLAREILVDYRPKAGVRFSPHFYNREEECDFALAQVEEILRTRGWEKRSELFELYNTNWKGLSASASSSDPDSKNKSAALVKTSPKADGATSQPSGETEFAAPRQAMLDTQLRRRGISDHAILSAMAAVPRHEFVPAEFRQRAYEDAPLPIGEGQTISQPYIVAAMTVALRLTGSERVLEIGSGLGYQAAILATLAKEVFTVEYRAELAAESSARLARLGYENVHVHCGDGTLGLPDFAPFDAILVAAAAPSVPPPLLDQLAHAGRLIVPVGDVENQELRLIERTGNSFQTTLLEPCRFVPLVGAHGWKESPFR